LKQKELRKKKENKAILNVYHTLIGYEDGNTLNNSFFNGISLITALFTSIALISNIIIGLPLLINFLTFICVLSFLALYYTSRILKKSKIAIQLYLGLFLLIIPSFWFGNGGLHGSTIHVVYALLAISVIILDKKPRIIFLATYMSMVMGLITIEYLYPSLILSYETRLQQFLDIIVVIPFSFTFISLSVVCVVFGYKKEKAKAEEANKLKTAFFSNMTHELRSPMNGILGFSELLREGDVDDNDQLKFVNIINENSKYLLRLINDLLHFSKIDANKIILQKSEVQLSVLAKEILEVFSQETKSKNIQLLLDLETEQSLITDDLRLKQVLMNLMANAVKFTHFGHVKLRISKKAESILFEVSDTGVGIPKSELKNIFKAYKQTENQDQNKYKGTGLGLSISKQLVELLGGTLELSSIEGQGSTFYFSLPILNAETPVIPEESYLLN
jgi:signal transduction histidine kinase